MLAAFGEIEFFRQQPERCFIVCYAAGGVQHFRAARQHCVLKQGALRSEDARGQIISALIEFFHGLADVDLVQIDFFRGHDGIIVALPLHAAAAVDAENLIRHIYGSEVLRDKQVLKIIGVPGSKEDGMILILCLLEVIAEYTGKVGVAVALHQLVHAEGFVQNRLIRIQTNKFFFFFLITIMLKTIKITTEINKINN